MRWTGKIEMKINNAIHIGELEHGPGGAMDAYFYSFETQHKLPLGTKIYAASIGAQYPDDASSSLDNAAMDQFHIDLKAKREKSRDKERSGWNDPEAFTDEALCDMLIHRMMKGNEGTFLDIGCLAGMANARGISETLLRERFFNYIQNAKVD